MKTPPSFTLRPANPNDAPLFYSVIERTMREFIFMTWGLWDEARVQNEAQIHSRSPNSQIIEIDNTAIGVLQVARHLDRIELEQIYLLPEYQRLGIGTALINRLITEAAASIVPVRLRVLVVNPAKQLYECLGFVITETTPEFFYMEKVS